MTIDAMADKATLDRATRTVFGVLGARATHQVHDSAFLIDTYLREETELGRSLASSWALLFSASANLAFSLLEQDAIARSKPLKTRLNEWSYEHAQSLK